MFWKRKEIKMPDDFTDDSIMPFGAHKGKRMEDVPADYLLWLEDNADTKSRSFHPALYGYISSVYDVLEEEVDDAKR